MWPTAFDPELFQRVRRLELDARGAVEGALSGRHRSPFFGSSLEFAEHREYVPGDELRRLDWRLYAKTDRFYVKQFEEETTLGVLFALDASASMALGGGAGSKLRFAAALIGAGASLVLAGHDAVGLWAAGGTEVLSTEDRVLRNDARESPQHSALSTQHSALRPLTALAPSSQGHHLLAVCRALDALQPAGPTTFWDGLPAAAALLRGRGLVIAVSDALEEPEAMLRALQAVRERHELVLLQVLAPEEADFPFDRYTRFRGLEAAEALTVDAAALARRYREVFAQHQQALAAGLARLGADLLTATTAEPPDGVLRRLCALRRGGR